MKKTLITILTLTGVGFGAQETYTLTTALPNENYNATNVYGFYLNLSENIKSSDNSEYTLTPNITLNSFKLEWAHGNNNVNNQFALMVVDSSNSVCGYSSYATVQNNGTGSYTFTAANGVDSLILSSSDTYRYLAVNSSVIDLLLSDTGVTYTYQAGTGAATLANSVISGGLVQISNRAYADNKTSYPDSLFIHGTDGKTTSVVGGYNLHVRPHAISVTTIPEPTTVTLSLLALAGLAARRRRR